MRLVRSFLRDVRPGDHIALFYESLGFKHEILSTYLKSGLQKGITTLYISHKEPVSDILRGMRSFGIDFKSYAKEGLFELWEITPDLEPTGVPSPFNKPLFTKPPSVPRSFDPLSDPFTSLLALLEGKMIKKPLVVVADDPLQNMEAEIAVNYEKSIDRAIHSLRTPISMICTYSKEEINGEGKLLLDLFKTHRHIIIQTRGTIISLEDALRP